MEQFHNRVISALMTLLLHTPLGYYCIVTITPHKAAFYVVTHTKTIIQHKY